MIPNLKQDTITQFKGKKTSVNLADGEPGTLLTAKNVMVLSDGMLRRAPGYTLVEKVGTGPIKAVYDFQRNVDNKQFVFVQSGSEIYVMNADGTGKTLLSTGETGTHQFVCNSFIAYSSDGHNAWRYIDVGGTLTKFKWNPDPPLTAPAISKSASTMTLKWGRQYVYCYVSKYTDSLGIERVSITAPSPISAHTGPIANQVVTLSAIATSLATQVTHIWIFATSDSPADTSATYYFAAEITNGTTSWGDGVTDDALDQTRLAPFDNHAVPPSPILTTFQNRVVFCNGSLIQLSGYSEIALGIPEETAPTSLFFNVPSGRRTISAATSLNEGTVLAISTQDYWYAYTGYNASTFSEQDRVASPGAAGPLALVMTPLGLAYLSANQSVRLWNGSNAQPASISDDISKSLSGTYGMSDLDSATLANAQCLWYDFGPMNLLVVLARTTDADPTKAGFNLMQLWSFTTSARDTSGEYGSSSGIYTQLTGTFQSDKLPTDYFTAAATVSVGFAGQPYIYTGDSAGNIYRWPDGFLDNTNPYLGSARPAWVLPHAGKSRYYWLDFVTDRTDAVNSFSAYAITADAPDQTKAMRALVQQNLPSPIDQSAVVVRASMNQVGVSTGKYVSFVITFPQDNADAVLSMVTVASRPLNEGIA